jgi:MoxR-like ATPase
VTEFGPLASAEVILLDEINRIPLKSQSAFLEALQDRTITVGKTTYDLPAFSFAIATMNPVELGQGTFPLSEAATDRFAAMVQIGYLPPAEEEKLVDFDFKRMTLRPLLSKQRIIELRAVISERVFLHKSLGRYVQRLVGATRPMDPDTDWRHARRRCWSSRGGPGREPRAIICWSRRPRCGRLQRSAEVVSRGCGARTIRAGHRIWLGPHAAGMDSQSCGVKTSSPGAHPE